MQINDVRNILDACLEPWRYKDYAPNGLQVEGKEEINKVVTGVTASQALIDAAAARGADAILVHHGYFWKGEDARICGMKKLRIRALLQHDISLLAYHLPLDGHLELGNNAQLGKVLGLEPAGQAGEQGLLWHGGWAGGGDAAAFADHVSGALGRTAQLLGRPDRPVRRVAWCTGGAQGFFADAIALGVDVFITGEASEQNYHMAMESDVAFIAAGHHATERFGIKALGEHLAQVSGINVEFIDVSNPV
ncbi:Nif3-like dinuclear metal center hexameric protein [Chromobacterium violaceum]|uniref:Nif3-like dinuclear metal center hexameric protein n=1 Tax=Chromobacterium violaceum TaxID=536 RepID=UPI000C124AC1|nr:Nif3-like dinuclear metal center hexameric protein [Chromobacterium violaceum]ATP30231.1 Nif3-like dinuclear metal center hexameric protein [Chromobacterium violaceum]ATP34137.1 Nif3-like dinuclear metal center hexameric protein [Chromobacterium violaceum]MBA8736586.1 Nif3-like dinuclear metal center hexameric protein [Chromobacterium violaceum]